jgi:hypothetical protein
LKEERHLGPNCCQSEFLGRITGIYQRSCETDMGNLKFATNGGKRLGSQIASGVFGDNYPIFFLAQRCEPDPVIRRGGIIIEDVVIFEKRKVDCEKLLQLIP